MKLEAKHIIPFFLHDIRIMIDGYETGIIGLDHLELRIGLQRFPYCQNVLYDDIKPILHPISDFSGKKTAGEVRSELNCTLNCVYEIWDLNSKDKLLEEISYETILVMCRNHIDFQRLIDNNLAIKKPKS